MNANPLFVGMVNENGKPGEEQAQQAPSGNVSTSEEDLQQDPLEARAQQRIRSQQEEPRAAEGEKPSGSDHDAMLMAFLQKQTAAIDTILTNQSDFRAQLDRAHREIEQREITVSIASRGRKER